MAPEIQNLQIAYEKFLKSLPAQIEDGNIEMFNMSIDNVISEVQALMRTCELD